MHETKPSFVYYNIPFYYKGIKRITEAKLCVIN